MIRRPFHFQKPFASLAKLLAAILPAACASVGPANPPIPPLAADQAQAIATSPTLHEAILLAAGRNPAIQAARLEWLAAIQREPQDATPPDPELYQAQYSFSESQWTGGALQVPTPWPGKLFAMGDAAALASDIARERYQARARDTLIEVKDAWYELYYLDQASAISERIEALLKNEATLAYGELARGRTQLGEAFRAESQAAQLGYDRILLAEQRASQAERLKALLDLPPECAIGPVRDAPTYPLVDSVEPLYARAERFASMLKIRGMESERSHYMTKLAKLARVPDPMEMLQVAGLRGSPTQTWMGMVTANLPIYEWKNRAAVLEKEAMQQAAEAMARDEGNMTRAATAQAYYSARLADRLVKLYAGTLLPQAESILRQSETDFRGEAASFSSVIETTLAYQNFLLAYHRAVADRGQAIGRLEAVLGTTAEPRSEKETSAMTEAAR